MDLFRNIVESQPGSKFILQGNEAFALGIIHAGYHAANGYPGTPSTEVIDKSLSKVQDLIKVGWSVNEAVAVAVAVGHSIAGFDAVVTMKIPGVFQAGDAISTSAFYTAKAGALVIYAATDYVPSSTQHVIDSRYFFSSARLPILEPRNHQEMYDIGRIAADLSKNFRTPVVILASGILAHSEGIVITKEQRKVIPSNLPEKLEGWMLMPGIARKNYNKATLERIPNIQEWIINSNLIKEETGTEDWGIIVSGESEIIVKEALKMANKKPSMLSLGISYPLPKENIFKFIEKIKGKIFIFEDGDKFVEEKIKLLGIKIIGKEENSIITDWTPNLVLEHLSKHINLNYKNANKEFDIKPLNRPPSICPGCPYRAFAITVSKLKKQKKIYAVFGDIGCSTLLYFLNSLDTVLCMGASDSMRQGFVMSRPDYANKTISVIGDSCECHSGLDSTRNSIFWKTPGIKVILDNSITAMTGGQPAPSSPLNFAGKPNTFNLKKAVEAEGGRTIEIDSYNLKEVQTTMIDSLKYAENGEFVTLILKGACIQETENIKKIRTIERNYDLCKKCGRCSICPGIDTDENKIPHFTALCTNCGSSSQVCMQVCPFNAIILKNEQKESKSNQNTLEKVGEIKIDKIEQKSLPESLRVAIRGIGGQGNLFFGKVLAEVALLTPYSQNQIVKGDTHGMAQLGGSVISTFACGDVFSPIFAAHSADVLVAMELSEILQPEFIDLLKPEGFIVLNDFKAPPVGTKKEDYPDKYKIKNLLSGYNLIEINALEIANKYGDTNGKTANVIVIGLLSGLKPFNIIPESIWLTALMKISKNDNLKSINKIAFEAGRNFVNSIKI